MGDKEAAFALACAAEQRAARLAAGEPEDPEAELRTAAFFQRAIAASAQMRRSAVQDYTKAAALRTDFPTGALDQLLAEHQAAGLAANTTASTNVGVSELKANNYPKTIQAVYVEHPLEIDGDLSKPEWDLVEWSEPFGDIQGDDAPEQPPVQASTRVKLLWDHTHLYVAAELNYPVGMPIEAHYTERNSPIFHTDSDFEVFIDAAGECRAYKELEINAINTVWNLMLDRPYSNGGSEHSGMALLSMGMTIIMVLTACLYCTRVIMF